jgi:hypothetical protein
MGFPQILNEMILHLKNINATKYLSNNFDDGRINSIANEDEILKILETEFNVLKPRARDWYDFAIEENGNFYPVNIKITNTKGNDNLSSKLGLYYALTGKIPSFPNEIKWGLFFQELGNNIEKNNLDYYFLVINKENSQDIFINSLKQLHSLTPNGNNLPFQCHWNRNRIPFLRTYEESRKFLLSAFYKSLELRANAYIEFNKYLGKYID